MYPFNISCRTQCDRFQFCLLSYYFPTWRTLTTPLWNIFLLELPTRATVLTMQNDWITLPASLLLSVVLHELILTCVISWVTLFKRSDKTHDLQNKTVFFLFSKYEYIITKQIKLIKAAIDNKGPKTKDESAHIPAILVASPKSSVYFLVPRQLTDVFESIEVPD